MSICTGQPLSFLIFMCVYVFVVVRAHTCFYTSATYDLTHCRVNYYISRRIASVPGHALVENVFIIFTREPGSTNSSATTLGTIMLNRVIKLIVHHRPVTDRY